MKGAVGALTAEHPSQWHRFLPAVAFAYRSTVVKSLGYSPFFMTHGRDPVLPGQLLATDKAPVSSKVSDFARALQKQLGIAFAHVKEVDKDVKDRRVVESPHTPDVVFKRGDKVLHYRTPTD